MRPDLALRDSILAASRAEGIPTGSDGLWVVKKFRLAKDFIYRGKPGPGLVAGGYTQLWRVTQASALKGELGELVMQDTRQELNTHLEFMLKARGRVLITGLGLGCAARGCLANPRVEHVTVIERDASVIRLVAPHMPQTDRLRIVVADALAWAEANREHFDSAWHDLWSDPDTDEPHLQVTHLQLLIALVDRTGFQGAWQAPRKYRGRTGNLI